MGAKVVGERLLKITLRLCMALCEEGEDGLRAGIVPAEIGVICAGRGVIGRDLRARRSIVGGE